MIRSMALPVPLVLALALTAGVPSTARADERSVIKDPGDHPSYVFEAEPHFLLGYSGPYDNGGSPGIGFRGTFHIANGFVPSINDSVGIGFGADIGGDGHVLIPIVMQWNFWLSTHWSVFGEPGFAFGSGRHGDFWPALFVGGRFHFTDRIALTLRIGYPAVSIGVSFLL
ncbi:MAG: hypothetical protein ACREJ3_19770 [Polyangiaceae bacterium]